MITVIAAGIGLLIVIAVVVGVVDAAQAARWRRVASERRDKWEARKPQFHGVDSRDGWDNENWDDD